MNYHEILAQHYEENARNLLIHQKEYPEDEDGQSVEPDHGLDKHPDELENQEAFNSFAPRNENTLPAPAPHNPTNAKNYKTHVLNVDSRFRAYQSIISKQIQLNTVLVGGSQAVGTLVLNSPVPPNSFVPSSSTNFAVRFGKQYRNIISVKLTTTEIPNTAYNFLDLYENKTFIIIDPSRTYTITIPSGNYTINSLVTEIKKHAPFTPPGTYDIVYEANSHKIAISGPGPFSIDFTSGNTSSPFLNGLGYHLGFVNQVYDTSSPNFLPNTYTAENVPDVSWNNYCYLVINDWDVVQHQDFNQSHFYAFAKIVLNADKNSINYDTNYTNTSTKEYIFSNPTNVETILIKLLDPYGNQLDLNGANFSFSLELREVLNVGAYEAAREF